MATEKCAHPSCTCVPPKGEKYCSEACKEAKDGIDLKCGCRHAACAAAA